MRSFRIDMYETLTSWHITASFRDVDDQGNHGHELVYRGQHVPIDEDDVVFQLQLLLHQLYTDVDWHRDEELPIIRGHVSH